MAEEDITQDDLMAALLASVQGGDSGFSFAEIQAATNWHTVKIRRELRRLKNANRLHVGKAARENIAGVYAPVPVYRLK